MEERFTYDLLDRLTGVVEGLDTTGVFAYDDYGRMTSKYLYGAGNCEYVTEGNGTFGTSYWLTYISGPLGVFAVRDTAYNIDGANGPVPATTLFFDRGLELLIGSITLVERLMLPMRIGKKMENKELP